MQGCGRQNNVIQQFSSLGAGRSCCYGNDGDLDRGRMLEIDRNGWTGGDGLK